jgi:release factor glutamine methyltransferase
LSTRQLKPAAYVQDRLIKLPKDSNGSNGNGTHTAVTQPTATGSCRDMKPSPFVWSLDRSSNVGRAILAATRRLREAGSETPQLDTAVLMAHVLGVSKTWLYAHPDRNLTEEEITRFEELARRRMAHEPVAYLVGYKSFFGLDITVDQRVLIPRPETEMLVERALACARRMAADGQPVRIVDVGTGSGAIAVGLAVGLPEAVIYATDLSDDALAVAEQNVWRYGVGEQVQLLPGYLLEPLTEPIHIIVANLPYIATADLPELPCEVREYEPVLALNGGPDGLSIIAALLNMLKDAETRAQRLLPGGRLFLEIGYDQGPQALALAQEILPDCQVEVVKDYAERDRVVIITV